MTLIKIENNKVIMTKKEKDLFYKMVERLICFAPKIYRKQSKNWVIISDITYHGSGYSKLICRYLGVDPDSYKWEVINND